MNPVLFLDFDGVLHPEPSFSHETFSQLPLVEAVLRAFLSVDIVISSTWRMNTPEERILRYFSKDTVVSRSCHSNDRRARRSGLRSIDAVKSSMRTSSRM